MGSSHSGNNTRGNIKLVTVPTENLKEKLNRIYDVMRSRPRTLPGSGLFEYLWDLKELALMEGRQSVQVPTTWLEELEQDLTQGASESTLGH